MLTNVGLSSEKGMWALCYFWVIKMFGFNANIEGRWVYKVVILEKGENSIYDFKKEELS